MKVIDSSGWLEFFLDGPLGSQYAAYLKEPQQVLTPTTVLYEVYKVIKRDRTEEEAVVASAQMGKTHVVPLTDDIALTAADASLAHHLAMADAIVYATALTYQAKVVTSDSDFENLEGVIYLKKS